MANRHLSRSIVLQTLFEWDFNEQKSSHEAIFDANIEEFAPGITDRSFALLLLKHIVEKREDLDQIIEKAAPEWPLKKISVVDRNVLRIGLYELLFGDRSQVPAKVAINEAVELAKTFGGETSGRFVNGVLGAIYKEIGEPGKHEQSKAQAGKKGAPPEVPFEKMPIERLVGAVIYAHDEKKIFFALVHDVFGHWTLSKGHLEEKEDAKEGVSRVVMEEIKLPITVEEEIGKNEYVASHPEKGKLRKQVIYFLAQAKHQKLSLKESGGLDAASWFSMAELEDLNFYDDILPIVTKAVEKISIKSNQ